MASDLTPKPADESTRAITATVSDLDPADFERAARGLIAQIPDGRIETELGVVWDQSRYGFIDAETDHPDTVHPGLWRQARLNGIHGLFEVMPGVWQARGYDLSNITFVAGETGWIIIDPLTAAPCAAACLDLANTTLGEREVVAVLYTHSHVDHFGGVHGVTDEDAVATGRCRIIAPEHFLAEAVSENVIAGPAMARRAHYQFGPLLPPGPRGHVDCGLGRSVPFWRPGLIAPTEEIVETGQELVVDGVRIVFQLTPGTEAPAEMNFHFPDLDLLCMAENCTHTMHNLIPIRGAQVRDALDWSFYIDEAIELFADRSEILIASHHWPRFGGDDLRSFLVLQRDLYRWVHDQTMRFANHGWTPAEIAEHLEIPVEFRSQGHTTGYYGHLVHNVKAVYQRYLSWYDGNPAHLWMLPETERARRYVDLAGGADRVLEVANSAIADGDHRWAAELLNHLVFAHPDDVRARALQADVLEQLGYRSESATFRNAYLTGAQELRHGSLPAEPVRAGGFAGALTSRQFFDSLAVRLRAEDSADPPAPMVMEFSDRDERWLVSVSNRTLYATPLPTDDGNGDPAKSGVRLERAVLSGLIDRSIDLEDPRVESFGQPGGRDSLAWLLSMIDTFETNFHIVEP
jgi:alkyl sulfatase BDS1-like metallo-beta-lactamase superfamily hydrolase